MEGLKSNTAQRVGLLGGSFDPPHLGHLILAQDVMEVIGLDGVCWIPNYRSPHKQETHLGAKERMELTRLMLEDDPRFFCSDIEVGTGHPQSTVDTVRKLIGLYPEKEFHWLIGADQLERLHTWKSISELALMMHWVVVSRPGSEPELPVCLHGSKVQWVENRLLDISSSEIRERRCRGLPVYMFLHPKVNECMEQNHYYCKSPSVSNA